jgi:uncharacterized membrane protein
MLWRDFQLALIGALALIALAVFGNDIAFLKPLQLVLGLLYVLYIPGYCLMAALFPERDALDGVERTGLSIALSIALVPVLSLVINQLPWGLRPVPILVGELAIILICMGIAIWRRSRLPATEAYAPETRLRLRSWWQDLAPGERRIYPLLSLGVLLGVLLLSWTFLVPSPDRFMTEFYILGKNGVAEQYTRQATLDSDLTSTLGITNREQGQREYRVEVWAVDVWDPNQRTLLTQQGPISLAPGETQQRDITWRMPQAGAEQQVEFLLFSGQSNEPYRRLRLWVDIAPPAN